MTDVQAVLSGAAPAFVLIFAIWFGLDNEGEQVLVLPHRHRLKMTIVVVSTGLVLPAGIWLGPAIQARPTFAWGGVGLGLAVGSLTVLALIMWLRAARRRHEQADVRHETPVGLIGPPGGDQ